MKLNCVSQLYRQAESCNERPLQSILHLGKNKPNGDCTLVIVTSKNPLGMKYKVANNITVLHNKFIGEGKLTIQFKDPAHRLSIKTKLIFQLQRFASTLQHLLKGNDTKLRVIGELGKPSNVSKTISVANRNQYNNIRYNSEVSSINISSIGLSSIDNRILKLQLLNELSIIDNQLTKIPTMFGDLPAVSKIVLAGNKLGKENDWSWLEKLPIRRSLKYLDLSNNEIEEFPVVIVLLNQLTTLLINDNRIKTLPNRLGRMESLNHLNLSSNMITCIPPSFRNMRLLKLDVWKNPLQTHFEEYRHEISSYLIALRQRSVPMKSLYELSLRSVPKTALINISPAECPRTVIMDLLNMSECFMCGKPISYKVDDTIYDSTAIKNVKELTGVRAFDQVITRPFVCYTPCGIIRKNSSNVISAPIRARRLAFCQTL